MLAVVAAAGACGGGGGGDQTDGGADGPPGPADAAPCPRQWTVTAAAGTSATVAGGALVLAGTDLDGEELIVSRDGLAGDFLIQFEAQLSAGGTGAYLQASVQDAAPGATQRVVALLHTAPAAGVTAADLPAGATQTAATADPHVVLQFERHGGTLAARAATGDGFAAIDATLTASPLRVAISLGSSAGPVGPETRAEISAFTVGPDTVGATTDSFDCRSLP